MNATFLGNKRIKGHSETSIFYGYFWFKNNALFVNTLVVFFQKMMLIKALKPYWFARPLVEKGASQ